MTVGGVTWAAFARAEPVLARRVRARLEARRHLVMATVRSDGSPRLAGTEAAIVSGELEIGVMAGAARLADLRADGRIAVHSGSDDPPAWTGDATVTGRVVLVDDVAAKAAHLAHRGPDAPDPGEWTLVRVRIEEAVVVGLDPTGTTLIVDSWRPGRGQRRTTRG